MRAVVEGAQDTTRRIQKKALTFINMGLLLDLSSEAPPVNIRTNELPETTPTIVIRNSMTDITSADIETWMLFQKLPSCPKYSSPPASGIQLLVNTI